MNCLKPSLLLVYILKLYGRVCILKYVLKLLFLTSWKWNILDGAWCSMDMKNQWHTVKTSPRENQRPAASCVRKPGERLRRRKGYRSTCRQGKYFRQIFLLRFKTVLFGFLCFSNFREPLVIQQIGPIMASSILCLLVFCLFVTEQIEMCVHIRILFSHHIFLDQKPLKCQLCLQIHYVCKWPVSLKHSSVKNIHRCEDNVFLSQGLSIVAFFSQDLLEQPLYLLSPPRIPWYSGSWIHVSVFLIAVLQCQELQKRVVSIA